MYHQFAQVYDRLMGDVDYGEWADYLVKLFQQYHKSPQRILDLACGTGNITIPLAKKGYEIIGVDLSEDMLSIADQKSNSQSVNIQWMCQDIRELQGFKNIDAIICACDGLNYVLREEELEDVFLNAYQLLNPKGIFTFDMNSQFKIAEVLGQNTFADAGEDISFIWDNYYDEDNEIVDFELSFFLKEGDVYKRFNEFHQQRAYSTQKIVNLLMKVGFKKVENFDAFTFNRPLSISERIQYIAEK